VQSALAALAAKPNCWPLMRLRDFGFCRPLFFSSLQSQKENESEIGRWLLAIAFVQVA